MLLCSCCTVSEQWKQRSFYCQNTLSRKVIPRTLGDQMTEADARVQALLMEAIMARTPHQTHWYVLQSSAASPGRPRLSGHLRAGCPSAGSEMSEEDHARRSPRSQFQPKPCCRDKGGHQLPCGAPGRRCRPGFLVLRASAACAPEKVKSPSRASSAERRASTRRRGFGGWATVTRRLRPMRTLERQMCGASAREHQQPAPVATVM